MHLTPAELWLILLGAFIAVCLLILLMGAVSDRIEEQQRNARCAARLRREFANVKPARRFTDEHRQG